MPYLARLRQVLSRVPLDITVLGLMPFMLLVVNNSWTFVAPAGWVDAYLYTGYMTDLKHYLNDFGPTYYGSRLPWLLYGSAVHSVFSYEAANLVLRFTLFYGATLPMYVIVRVLCHNRLAATVSAIVLGTHAAFLGAISWNYPDGVCIALMLLTMMCLTLACGGRAWQLLMTLAGFLIMTTLSNQLFLILLVPLTCGSWYVLLNLRWGKRRLIHSVTWVVAGACLAFVVYGLCNAHLVGRFNYLQPQIAARHINGYAYGTKGWAWVNHAGWLAFPALGVAIGLVLLLRGARSWSAEGSIQTMKGTEYAGACAGLVMIEATAVLGGFQLFQGPILQFVFYASYFIPFVFLTIGVLLASALPPVPRRASSMALVVLVAIIQLGPLGHNDLLSVPRFGGLETATPFNSDGRAWLLLAGGTLFVAALTVRKIPLILVALTSLSCANVLFSDERMLFGSDRETARTQAQMVHDATVMIDRSNQNGDVRYWYSTFDQFAGIFRGVASTHLYQFRLVSEDFPKLTFPDRAQPNELVPGQTIAILSSSDEALEAAKAAAPQVSLEVVDAQKIRRGKDAFNVLIVHVSPADFQPAGEIRLSLLRPYEQPFCAQLKEDRNGGVDLTLDSRQQCYGAVAVLQLPDNVVPRSAYIRALVTVSSGTAGIGVSRATGEFIDILSIVGTGDVRGTKEIYLRIPDLRQAYYFVVRNGQGRVPARLRIQRVTLYLRRN